MTDRCQIPRCRDDPDLTYLGHGLCSPHWQHFTSDNQPADALRKVLGIAAEPEQLEDTMPKTKKTDAAKPEKTAKKAPRELRTVAVRLPEADFQKLHRAAGDRMLATFMRTTLLAAAEKALSK